MTLIPLFVLEELSNCQSSLWQRETAYIFLPWLLVSGLYYPDRHSTKVLISS